MESGVVLLKSGSTSRVIPALGNRTEDDAPDFTRIRCPLCAWQPKPADRWYCGSHGHPEYFDGGCGTAWNTFETRGRCPGCDHQWRWTVCLSCDEWTPHDDWYVPDDSAS